MATITKEKLEAIRNRHQKALEDTPKTKDYESDRYYQIGCINTCIGLINQLK